MALDGYVADAVESHGYSALFGLIVLENLFPPIPSELILPLAGYYVERGTFAFALAVAVATLGSVVGALIIYTVARLGGRPLVLRYGRMLRVDEATLLRADERFERHDGAIVFFGRLVPGIRSVVSIPAGFSRMPIWRFTLLTAIGSAVWNALLIGIGYSLGSAYGDVGHVVGPMSRVVLALLIAGIAAWGVRAHLRRRSSR